MPGSPSLIGSLPFDSFRPLSPSFLVTFFDTSENLRRRPARLFSSQTRGLPDGTSCEIGSQLTCQATLQNRSSFLETHVSFGVARPGVQGFRRGIHQGMFRL